MKRLLPLLFLPALAGASPHWLEGAFDNAGQMAQLAPTFSRTPTPGAPWVDAQHARFVAFPAPLLGEIVYYLEWRTGDAAGTISRQRVWAFRRDAAGWRMDFYSLTEGEAWAAAAADPEALAALAAGTLLPYPPGCALVFASAPDGSLRGAIADEACTITARASGRRMRIEAQVELQPDGFDYDEAGLLEDGRIAFRVPEGARYRFRRVE